MDSSQILEEQLKETSNIDLELANPILARTLSREKKKVKADAN